MKARMLVHGSGPDGAVKPGSEIVVSEEHGEELLAGGYAEEVPEPAVEETPEPETDETEAEEPAAEDVTEMEAEEPAVEETPEPEAKKKAPRKRRRTAKSGT